MIRLVAFFFVVAGSRAEEIMQCKCLEFEQCDQKYEKAFRPCIDECTAQLGEAGVNSAAVKRCMEQSEAIIHLTFACFRNDHMKGCARGTPKMVPKRYAETLKMSMIDEIHAMTEKSGTLSQAGPLIEITKKTSNCVQACMGKAANNCYKAMNCGLLLPTDKESMRSTKDCAIRSGFNHTVEMQKLCRCISTNGIKSVNKIFAKSKWVISTCNGIWGEENCTKKSCNRRLKSLFGTCSKIPV